MEPFDNITERGHSEGRGWSHMEERREMGLYYPSTDAA